jgi:hypothetical protein
MVAVIAPTCATALFRPTNRFRDLMRERIDDDSYELGHELTEVELLPDLPPETVLLTGIKHQDFHRYLRGKVAWMGPDVFVCTYNLMFRGYRCVVGLGSRLHFLRVYAPMEQETAAVAITSTCDFAVRLLATSDMRDVRISGNFDDTAPVSISGPILSHFFHESQDNLRKVILRNMILNEAQIGALATAEFQPNMKVVLDGCRVESNDCLAGFVECLQRDRGPTQLLSCIIDYHAALEGNSRITRLRLPGDIARLAVDDAEKGVIFRSLAGNRGLVNLDVVAHSISDENWTILCQSLKGHPTLTSLDLRYTHPRTQDGARIEMSTEQKSFRTRVLAAMAQENRVLLTIALTDNERDEQIYEQSILPYLETNFYRPRVLGIKKADIQIRRPLLGRALQTKSVRNKSNLLWMFLSGNQDVVLPSDEEDSEHVVKVEASGHVEIVTTAPVVVAASEPVEIAARVQAEGEATRKRKY